MSTPDAETVVAAELTFKVAYSGTIEITIDPTDAAREAAGAELARRLDDYCDWGIDAVEEVE